MCWQRQKRSSNLAHARDLPWLPCNLCNALMSLPLPEDTGAGRKACMQITMAGKSTCCYAAL